MFINQKVIQNRLFDNKKYSVFLVTILLALTFFSCKTIKESKPIVENNINFNHFNHLYKEIDLNGKKVGIVHIYSEYPDY